MFDYFDDGVYVLCVIKDPGTESYHMGVRGLICGS